MEHYGLIGHPLAHSFSHSFFTRKFSEEGIEAVYNNYDMENLAEEFPALLRTDPLLRGLNVTIPYKQAIMPLLDKIDREAAQVGAVNTITLHREGGKLRTCGHNTDVFGFFDSIEPIMCPHHNRALVLGTGGASKAVIYALQHWWCMTVTQVSRTPGEGHITYEEVDEDVIAYHKIIINCTPLGMFPHINHCPDIPYDALTPDHLLYDLVYNPLMTRFLQLGQEAGCTVKNGLEMLQIQAREAWKLWQANR